MAKILIIDDDTFISEILRKHLVNHNYEAEVALNGKKGIELFNKAKFDLVVCDFRLPDSSGMEVLKQIRSSRQDVPVIIITAYADVRMAVKLMQMGASDYITKPIHQEEFILLINRLLHHQQSVQIPGRAEQQPQTSYQQVDFVTGKSEQIKHVLELSRKVAPTNISVLIKGETGTGKEYIARYIHENSARRKKPFVAIDCGAIPGDLANSELFGHIKGSFTGAITDKEGVFQKADGGTLFLDEIGNLSYEIQLKLLRAVQERVVTRLGDTRAQKIDIRLISATNEDLGDGIKDRSFREDLFHRINEFSIDLPAIRDRGPDVILFAEHFIKLANEQLNRNIIGLSPEVEQIFMSYSWPGNLRELNNVIKRAVLMSPGMRIEKEVLPQEIAFPPVPVHANEQNSETKSDSILKNAMWDIERQLIIKTILDAGYNKSKAARLLKIDRKTLYNKIKLYQIDI
ncbi:MAG: sigma-54 dependent transcriptional regulator [Lentimicrobiaceae bacterium]|nr:sigma-54 dependent transcriptional regulator [Lentimicrobiaceae bacterium]